MNLDTLQELALYQRWADAQHWNVLRQNPSLLEDAAIRKQLNHMNAASVMLCTLARGETPDMAALKATDAADLEAAMREAAATLDATMASADLTRSVQLPRGPKGPFEAPVGVLIMQAILHRQHHRAQNASRMRELGVEPPMTDYILWHALGRPE